MPEAGRAVAADVARYSRLKGRTRTALRISERAPRCGVFGCRSLRECRSQRPNSLLTIDQAEHFLVRGNNHLEQTPKVAQKGIRSCKFPSASSPITNRCPRKSLPSSNAVNLIAGPRMIDPDRRIDENHLRFIHRRGSSARSGSLPFVSYLYPEPLGRRRRRASGSRNSSRSARRVSRQACRSPTPLSPQRPG